MSCGPAAPTFSRCSLYKGRCPDAAAGRRLHMCLWEVKGELTSSEACCLAWTARQPPLHQHSFHHFYVHEQEVTRSERTHAAED